MGFRLLSHFRFLSLVVLLCAMPLMSPAGDKKVENPFKKAKIGDHVMYKITSSVNGKDDEIIAGHTVTAKNDKEVTVRTVWTSVNGTVTDKKIDLTKPYDEVTAHSFSPVKWEKTGEGKEKVKIGDKTYNCNWISGKGIGEFGGTKEELKFKIWIDNSEPLSGMVKMEMETKYGQLKISKRVEIMEGVFY